VKPIVTLTLNPTIDSASEADVVRPVHTIRTTHERYYPGGGGVNVARVIATLGGAATPVYLNGGATGALLDQLMERAGFAPVGVTIRGDTRISHAVFERATGLEYRFVPEGPRITEEEWRRCLATLAALDFDWLVASGSLPRGLPDDSYAAVARVAAERGARFVLDTSGPALAGGLAGGRVTLAKPSIGELRNLTGAPLEDAASQDAAALDLLAGHDIEMVVVSLGHQGALLAREGRVLRLTAPPVKTSSATGAGDSFVGAMVFALAGGADPETAFRLGVAAGTAAVLTPGAELCRREDVLNLAGEVAVA
jgi:6-phosphofructokinase 2